MSAPGLPPLTATVIVILAIVEGAPSVLLIHRSAPPERDRWALPGGRYDAAVPLEQAAAEKLVAETGASDLYLEQLFTASGLDATRPSVAVAYLALVDAAQVRLAVREEWTPRWFPLDALPPLAFDNNRLIGQAVERVRAKLQYSNIAHGLLPASFTLSEIHAVYEAILGRPLDRRNFRKWILARGLIEPTGAVRREGAHRPAQLYRFVTRDPVLF